VLLARAELSRQRGPVGQRRERDEGEEHRQRIRQRPEQHQHPEDRIAREHDPLGWEAALDAHQPQRADRGADRERRPHVAGGASLDVEVLDREQRERHGQQPEPAHPERRRGRHSAQLRHRPDDPEAVHRDPQERPVAGAVGVAVEPGDAHDQRERGQRQRRLDYERRGRRDDA
jgi:hypothetical protein